MIGCFIAVAVSYGCIVGIIDDSSGGSAAWFCADNSSN
jgi:hypothetical protein